MNNQLQGAAKAGLIADKAIDDLFRLETQLERDLLAILLRLDTVPSEDSLLRAQLQTRAAVLRQIQNRLIAEGEQLISVTGQRAVEAVAAVLGAPSDTLQTNIKRELDAIVDGQLAEVSNQFKLAQDEIRDAINKGILSGGSLAELVQAVQQKMSTTYSRASAAVDTAIMAAGRLAVYSDALDSGVEFVWVYVGPRDDKNREFCKAWVGKACTDPSKLDNKQNLPVEAFAGGYNCRHSWAPSTIEDAIAQGIEILTPQGQSLLIEVEI